MTLAPSFKGGLLNRGPPLVRILSIELIKCRQVFDIPVGFPGRLWIINPFHQVPERASSSDIKDFFNPPFFIAFNNDRGWRWIGLSRQGVCGMGLKQGDMETRVDPHGGGQGKSVGMGRDFL